MTPQELKNSILQLAIAGKLVKQRAEEGTAEKLFAQIQAEKQRLVAEGKLKKQKPLPEITEEEKPFDIPESWKWVRFQDLMLEISTGPFGSMLHKTDYIANGIPLVNPANIINSRIVESDKMMISEETANRLGKYRLSSGMIVMGRRGEMGRCAIVEPEQNGWVCGTGSFFMNPSKSLHLSYMIKLFSTVYAKAYLAGESVGTTMSNLNHTILRSIPIPLPPLAEQKRIVAKIEQLLPYIDRYEKAWSRLQEFNKRFPSDMQKSLLQYAIEGKLVKQRAEEGTAEELFAQIQAEKQRLVAEGKLKKQKPLPEITEEEKPFDIPESWKWVRLGEVIYNPGQVKPTEKFCYIDIGSIDNEHQKLGTKENVIEASKAPSRARKIVQFGDIIYATVRPYLHNMAIIDREFTHKPIASTGFAVMTCCKGIFNKYLFNLLLSPYFDSYANATDNAKGVAYPAINDDKLYKAILPLPPLAEQKRIVARLEELLPLCDRLKK